MRYKLFTQFITPGWQEPAAVSLSKESMGNLNARLDALQDAATARLKSQAGSQVRKCQ